jgi:hypothetical protein
MSQLLKTIGSVSADMLTVDHLRRYMVYCYEKLNYLRIHYIVGSMHLNSIMSRY